MRIINKIVESKTEPSNKNDIWLDGEVFKIYKVGEWQAFTLELDAANKIKQIIDNASNVYQEKLTAGKGIIIENNTISTEKFFQIVDKLPTKGEHNTIYLIASKNKEDENTLIEYIWLDNKWEKLGEFKAGIDLSLYVTKEEFQETFDELGTFLNESFTELSEGIGKKADKEEVTAVAESVSMLSQEIESNYNNFTESLDALEQKVDNLPQGEEFDAEGNYPLLHVGTADDLAGRGESVPAEFGFRASGGKSIKDGRAYIKRIKGNSVVWNQKVEKTYIDGDRVLENIDVIPQNHKFALIRSKAFGGCYYFPSVDVYNYVLTDGEYAKIFVQSHVVDAEYSRIYSTGESGYIQLIDLTQMFGAGNEPTTIEDFNARVATLGVDMNAYNEGQVIHCNTESIKSVGDNAWDEEWKRGYYMGKEYISVATNQICSANPIPCLPNEAYCVSVTGKTSFPNTIKFTFLDAQGDSIGEVKITNTDQKITTPINATSFLVSFGVDYGDTYKNDILISLYHSGWKAQKDDQYQPYWQDTLPLPIIRKYFPDGMKKAGTAHDEIRYNKASGKWEYSKGRFKSVDLGSFGWYKDSTRDFFKVDIDEVINTNYLCAKYMPITYQQLGVDIGISCVDLGGGKSQVRISDTSYTDAVTFKAAMQGVMLYYESNDWEWVELDAEDQNFRDYYNVADFGTEQSQSSVPSAPFSADIIYQFNAVDMIREHELEITELQKVIATMQAQLASLTSNY